MTRKTATLKSQPTSPPKDEPPSATVITFPLLKVSDNVEAIARVLSAMPPEDFSRAFMKLAADRSDLLVRDATFSKQVDDLWAWYYGILDARDRLKGVKRGRPITT